MLAVKHSNLDKLEEVFWAVSTPSSPRFRQFLTLDQLNAMVRVVALAPPPPPPPHHVPSLGSLGSHPCPSFFACRLRPSPPDLEPERHGRCADVGG